MVYVLLADGFEDIETIATVDVLRRAGAEVAVVGVGGDAAESSHGVRVCADISLADVNKDDLEMLVLPGGTKGVENIRASKEAVELIVYCCENEKLIGAICAAPVILAELGFLSGKRAVCYPSCEQTLIDKGAKVPKDERVIHDRNIVTAQAAGSSIEFGLKLTAMLKGWESAERVRRAMCFDSGTRALS